MGAITEDWNKFNGKPRGGYPFFQAFFQGPGERMESWQVERGLVTSFFVGETRRTGVKGTRAREQDNRKGRRGRNGRAMS